MKRKMLQMFALIVAGAAMGSSGLAQDRTRSITPADKYLVSANAGGVSIVEGDVTVLRKSGLNERLLKRDSLEIGDVVSTGATGKAEILLNPGSFLRLGSNSKFSFRTTDLNDLQISLTAGNAMFEVIATDDFTVSVFTPKESLTLIDSGVYRVDLLGDGTGTLSVVEGKAEIGDYPPTVVTKGRMTSIGTSNTTVAKFDRGKRDELAEWSRTRGKDIAKMTSSLRNPSMRNTLAGTYLSGRWNFYNSFGLWVFNPSLGGFCFLPFGSYWNSPYGYGYGQGIGWYNLPLYYPLPVNQAPSSPTRVAVAPTTETPSDPVHRPKQAEESFRRTSPPPYMQIDRRRDGGGGGKGYDPFAPSRGDFGGSRNNTPSSSPSTQVYVPQMAPAPVVSAPPVSRDVKPVDH